MSEPLAPGIWSLVPLLRLSIPLWQHKMKHLSRAQLIEKCSECGSEFASSGDVLTFGNAGRKAKGKAGDIGLCGKAFNNLAQGFACMLLLGAEQSHIEEALAQIESDVKGFVHVSHAKEGDDGT